VIVPADFSNRRRKKYYLVESDRPGVAPISPKPLRFSHNSHPALRTLPSGADTLNMTTESHPPSPPAEPPPSTAGALPIGVDVVDLVDVRATSFRCHAQSEDVCSELG
jgi:hypothetical protein